MTLEIAVIDPDDEAAVGASYEIYLATGRADQASFIAAPYDELARVIRTPTEDFSYVSFLATRDGVAVGSGWYAEFLRTNLDQVVITPRTLPGHRRQGVGSAVLARMEEHALSRGRTLINATPRWPLEFGPDAEGAPNVDFARARGYDLKLVEAKRKLQLPVAERLLVELAARVDPAYTIRAFVGAVPDELVEGWAELEASLPTEAPTGEMETEAPEPSVDVIRADERLLAETGQVKVNAVALSPGGEVVGYTDIVVSNPREPAPQWGTLVRRAHRGHGLGYGLKASVISLLQSEFGDVPSTVTSNALDNPAMVAVNDRLGYQVLDYLGDVQKRIAP
jgi:GNAT superfamily N-acetyltransferase